MKLPKSEFDSVVRRAIRRIPSEIRGYLDNILITVQKRPSRELLAELGMAPDEPLLGIFQGVPLMERSVTEPPLYPDTIFLFQEPLENMCVNQSELEEEIEITVVHEVAHYLGLTEEELIALGYG
jgi:predicted Zn-dependent protease with MMP-like domain